ncbi:MAG: pilus assembly protein [Mariniblastus sp.]|nr:pilus assembly protein [Mariniblastus sp.]
MFTLMWPRMNRLLVDSRSIDNASARSVLNRRACCGAATVELVLVAPFILMIVFGTFELARMMMVKQALTNAAREGCRHATLATVKDHLSAERVVRDLVRSAIAKESEVVSVVFSPEFNQSPESGTKIRTVVEVRCADISCLPETFFGGAKVRGIAHMNRE